MLAQENSVKPSGLLFGFLPPRKVLPEEELVRHNSGRAKWRDLPDRLVTGVPRTPVRRSMFAYGKFLPPAHAFFVAALLRTPTRATGDSVPPTPVVEPTTDTRLSAWPAADFVGRIQYVPCPRRGSHLRLVDCWMCWCDEHGAMPEGLGAGVLPTVAAGYDASQSAA